MKASPQTEDYAKQWLRQIPEFDEEYLELDNALNAVQRGELLWQPIFSVSVYVWCMLERATHPILGTGAQEGATYEVMEPDKRLVKSLVNSTLPQLARLLENLEAALSTGSYDEEMSRLLFHLRVATGSLYLANGELEPAAKVLDKAMFTRYNTELRRLNIWGVIEKGWFPLHEGYNVPMTTGVALGKHIAIFEMEFWHIVAQNLEPLIRMLTFATGATPSEYLFDSLRKYTWHWALLIRGLIRERGSWENVNHALELFGEEEGVIGLSAILLEDWDPKEQWMCLLHRLANIVVPCVDEGDEEELPLTPEESRITSANYWAWELGQMVAILWQNEGQEFVTSFMERYEPDPDKWLYGLTILSLVAECDDSRDWESAREFYLDGWRRTAKRHVHQLFQEGPDSGLYWAMRVGLADGFIDPPQLPTPGYPGGQPLPDDEPAIVTTEKTDAIEAILGPKVRADIESALNGPGTRVDGQELLAALQKLPLEVQRIQETVESRLPPDRRKITQFLSEQLIQTS